MVQSEGIYKVYLPANLFGEIKAKARNLRWVDVLPAVGACKDSKILYFSACICAYSVDCNEEGTQALNLSVGV
jgi:hypothetical protein